MKTLSSIFFAASFYVSSCAQNIPQTNVPAIVVNSFQQQFPNAGDIEWERKGSLYEVEFETGLMGADHTMLIDSLGKVHYHKAEIKENELPDQVKATISREFKGFSMHDVEKIERIGTITYKVELKNKPEEWEVLLSEDGKVLEKKAD